MEKASNISPASNLGSFTGDTFRNTGTQAIGENLQYLEPNRISQNLIGDYGDTGTQAIGENLNITGLQILNLSTNA